MSPDELERTQLAQDEFRAKTLADGAPDIDWGEDSDVPFDVCDLENPETCESCQ